MTPSPHHPQSVRLQRFRLTRPLHHIPAHPNMAPHAAKTKAALPSNRGGRGRWGFKILEHTSASLGMTTTATSDAFFAKRRYKKPPLLPTLTYAHTKPTETDQTRFRWTHPTLQRAHSNAYAHSRAPPFIQTTPILSI